MVGVPAPVPASNRGGVMTTAADPTSPQSLHEGWGGARAVLHGPLRKLVTGQALGQGADGLAQIAFASVVLFDIGKGATPGRDRGRARGDTVAVLDHRSVRGCGHRQVGSSPRARAGLHRPRRDCRRRDRRCPPALRVARVRRDPLAVVVVAVRAGREGGCAADDGRGGTARDRECGVVGSGHGDRVRGRGDWRDLRGCGTERGVCRSGSAVRARRGRVHASPTGRWR